MRHSLTARQVLLLRALGLLLGGLLLGLAACAGDDGGTDGSRTTPLPTGNLLPNPSFEEGRNPWFSKASWGTSFAVDDRQAHSGRGSALLELRSQQTLNEPVRVYGVVQEVTPEEFPEQLSGYYYVERWEKGTPKQYLQFVVIVDRAENIPKEVAEEGAMNHQIRYILAGVEGPPTNITNARYVMVTRSEPKVGEWVYFERNIRDDFQQLWGDIPRGYDKLALFFEVRWDDRLPQHGFSAADIYYDDLYLGPAGQKPEGPTGY